MPGPGPAPGHDRRHTVPTLTRLARAAALAGYFGLLILLTAWFTLIEPSPRFPVVVPLVALVGPLLFPLMGLLNGRRYTHAWTSFLALFYFTAGVFVYAGGESKPWLPVLEIALSILLFLGCIFYVRLAGKV